MSQDPQPILAFFDGIDEVPHYLTTEEIKELTSSGAGLGDWFAQWLAATPEAQRALSFRDLLTKVAPPNSYKTFAIADGTPIVYDHKNPNNPLNSVSRHLRFITVVIPDISGSFDISQAILKRTLCIVGSSYPDGTDDSTAFLQCASWDPDALGKKMGMMRFYERSTGWEYFGNGLNAFNPSTENFMPFCGHVGGTLIMKELTVPWTHWYNIGNINEFVASIGSTRTTPSLCDPHNALYDPLFTPPQGPEFSLLGKAEDFEAVVEVSVSKWYISRWTHDFIDPSSKNPFVTITTVIKQWVGNILLNRSMNIAASATSTAQAQAASAINGIPTTMFCNLKALTLPRLLPSVAPPNAFTATNAMYVSGMAKLELSLFYDDFSTDPPTRKLAVQGSEGPFTFPIIEPGIEDTSAINTLLSRSSLATLLPPKAIAAFLMVDFYNPIYSARRMSLMKYVPDSAQFNTSTKTYNVIEQFTANVSASPDASDPASPEYEVLHLLNTPDDKYVTEFTGRVNTYLNNVALRFATSDIARQEAIDEYMLLAEGRRRLFKGFEDSKPDGAGLDEFRLTLPIAVQPNPFVLTNMKENGEVQVMPEKEAIIIKGPLRRSPGMPASHPAGREASGGSCPAQRKWVRRALM
ncbi:hypothetical protein BDZ94DRAFT_997973 [Collybia nuda]|uniref:Major capsid protein n=1 Tax=Collybia nuda TaxID=64659 RepID=A0A9P5XZU7_9AGAR|nr:hypothetical protein BDZ94DRAFT_997973 [Collybia nuda]